MKIRIIDLHNDVIIKMSAQKFAKYLSNAWKHGVKTMIVSVWTCEMTEPLKQIKDFQELTRKIVTPIKLLLHIEDAWFLTESNIDELIRCKPYSVGLTWNKKNALAGGANSDGNLTPLGRTLTEKLISHGIKIDLAHLNKTSFETVAEILCSNNQKLMCSHTCFDDVNMHMRNLDYNQIQTIVNSDGIIGLAFVGSFLSANAQADINDVVTHINYFLQNFGENNIAIGTDFFGTADLPKNLHMYKNFRKLKKILLANGLSEKTIDKILFANAERFLDAYINT